MVCWRAEPVGIGTQIDNDTFRATDTTAYLRNGVTLKIAAAVANASASTMQLYDQWHDAISVDELERIR